MRTIEWEAPALASLAAAHWLVAYERENSPRTRNNYLAFLRSFSAFLVQHLYIKEKPMVFSEVCHSCGGCSLVCPEHAVTEKEKPIGKLEIGRAGEIKTVTGILNPGEASGIPIIREALKQTEGLTIIDGPPGSACSVMESVMDADYCVLVAEPTAFGFHNFQMVYELVTLLGRKCGVLINKEDTPYEPLERFCLERDLPILGRIPYDPKIGAMAAKGELVCEKIPELQALFLDLLKQIGGAV